MDNLTKHTNENGSIIRQFDELGRVIIKNDNGLGAIQFKYDLYNTPTEGQGTKETTIDPKGNTTIKVYDLTSRLIQVIDHKGNKTTYAYYPNGNQKSITLQDKSVTAYTYFDNNKVKTVINKTAAGAVVSSFSYTYDPDGNRLTETNEQNMTKTYVYDSASRLIKETRLDGSQVSYAYDGAGNRLRMTETDGAASVSTAYTYDKQNRLVATEERGSLTQTANPNRILKTIFTNDNNGNLHYH